MARMKRTLKRLYWNHGMLLFDKYLHGFGKSDTLNNLMHFELLPPWCCRKSCYVPTYKTSPTKKNQKHIPNLLETHQPSSIILLFPHDNQTEILQKTKEHRETTTLHEPPPFKRTTTTTKKKSPWWHLAKLKGGQKISAVAKSVSVALSNGTNLRSKGSPAQANWDHGNGRVSKPTKNAMVSHPRPAISLGETWHCGGNP